MEKVPFCIKSSFGSIDDCMEEMGNGYAKLYIKITNVGSDNTIGIACVNTDHV